MTPAPAAEMTADQLKAELIADVVRRDITSGTIPPGTQIQHRQLARRFSAGRGIVPRALKQLSRERLAFCTRNRWYAGNPSPDADARIGQALALLRAACGLTPEQLAEIRFTGSCVIGPGFHAPGIREAEAGIWMTRAFWEACDTALGAGGSLLRLHDHYYRCRPAGTPRSTLVLRGRAVSTAGDERHATIRFRRHDDPGIRDQLPARPVTLDADEREPAPKYRQSSGPAAPQGRALSAP